MVTIKGGGELLLASILFHESIFQVLPTLAEWHDMLELKKIRLVSDSS